MANYYTESPIEDPDQLGYEVSTDLAADWSGSTEELIIDYSAKKIALKVQGNLTNDGATVKAVYSKLKDIWRTDTSGAGSSNLLIKFPFPMSPITDEQFEMVNGWNWDKGADVSPARTSGTDGVLADTTQLLRTGGWQVVNTAGNATEEWAGIISLGALGQGDQVYYDQSNNETADSTVNFVLKSKVNQAVQIFRDDDGDGITAENNDFNRRSYFKMFCREWKKTYAASAFSDIGVSVSTFQAYRFPLTNATDLKATHAEALVAGTGISATASSDGDLHTYTVSSGHGVTVGEVITITGFTITGFNLASQTVTAVTDTTIVIDASTPYTGSPNTDTGGTITMPVYSNMSILYSRDKDNARVLNSKVKGLHDATSPYDSYVIGDVVQSNSNGEWYIAILDHTSAGTDPSSDATNWAAYAFDREISDGSGNWYAFTVAVDGDTTTATYDGGAATAAQIYEYVQYNLRLNTNIDDDPTSPVGVVIGKTADSLLSFVGDTLVTSNGVFVDSFKNTEVNSIDFYDAGGVVRRYDFTSFLIINFGQNLQDDEYAKYWVFFTNDSAADSPAGNNYGTAAAIIVDDATGTDMAGDVNNTGVSPYVPRSSVSHSFNYDGNVQRGTGSAQKDAPVTVVAIGLTKGQYVKAEGTIGRSKTNTVSLIASLERNYSQGTTFP